MPKTKEKVKTKRWEAHGAELMEGSGGSEVRGSKQCSVESVTPPHACISFFEARELIFKIQPPIIQTIQTLKRTAWNHFF